jgi:methylglutaconyl-CoA hydratase
MTETIRIDRDERGVATIWMVRTDKHNALSALMMDELTEAANTLGADQSVRVVVLAAEGKSFCAGGDLGWMQSQMDADAATKETEARRLANMLWALNFMPKPLIGRLQGNAFGGGVGLASVCDVAIGVESLKMGLTETKLGLIPATIGPYILARMGEAMARRVFMSSRLFDAHEAVTLGLLARVVATEELDAAIESEVAPYLNCAPQAVGEAKALVQSVCGTVTRDAVDTSVAALAKRWNSPESVEGISAFFEKRKADWVI